MPDFAERVAQLSPKRLALLALDLKAQLDKAQSARSEPIAIIGMGCRFPGAASSPEAFWRALREGVDAIGEVPRDRWDADAFYDPDPDAPGKMWTRCGGFLEGVEAFDSHFFGIAPREAQSLDPQQRLLLEVAWEAIENAGLAPEGLEGSKTGVFLGVSGHDYHQFLLASVGREGLDAYSASGNSHATASGRLSYFLGLTGPSLSIDTACSSSLVATHLACQSLRSGESDLALACGVNLILTPETSVVLTKARMLAPDGRCKAFDDAADGFSRGEGCGVAVLKRLSDARRDGDRIAAVIAGTASNQDGRSNGLTAPNGPAQEAVIRAALADAGIEASAVDYVETHGTGTSLGDPIEARALDAVLGVGRDAARPLAIGSVKTNIGHLESAAGMAGLIKVVLALQNREIPPHLHLKEPNRHIEWDRMALTIPTQPTPWERNAGGRRMAGVSSFGFSGTNVHLVVQEAPEEVLSKRDKERHKDFERPRHLLTLSAKTPEALDALAQRYSDRLQSMEEERLADVCFSANVGRSHFGERLALAAASRDEARARLDAFRAGEKPENLARGKAEGGRGPAFLFTGQGSQHVGMGRELYDTQPVFRETIERCDALLRPCLPGSLLATLYPTETETSALDEARWTQPALFALEFALAQLWRSWGIRPVASIGHSIGEYAAACDAGVFSLEDGLRLVAERGRLMQALPEGGAMAAVLASAERVGKAIEPHTPRVAIAALNAPETVVISGEAPALEAILAELESEGIGVHRLKVSNAFHSPLVEPMLDEFECVAESVAYAEPRIRLVSNVSGRLLEAGATPNAPYWRRHLREPVRFAEGIRSLYEMGVRTFIEIGPTPTLSALGPQSLVHEPEGARCLWAPSLRPSRGDWEQMLESLGRLYVRGQKVDWAAFDAPYARRRVAIPTYPFQRQRHWPEVTGAQTGNPATDARIEGLFYEVNWRAAPCDEADRENRTADWLPAPAQIASSERQAFPDLIARHNLALYDTLLPRMDALCLAYVLRALDRLGYAFRVGASVSVDSFMAALGILAGHRRLVGRLLAILDEEGFLEACGAPDSGEWRVVRVPIQDDSSADAQALLEQFPRSRAEITMLERCGAALAEALRGACDPLQLLFPDNSMEVAESMYRDAPASQAFNGLAQGCVARALDRLPADRNVRIIEIGAGTGAVTACVLGVAPPDRTQYTFTDVSPHFTQRAAAKFVQYPFVRYAPLDICQDVEAQGMRAHSFDIVVAANVLHATSDLSRTLRNIRRLMAPGALLVLLENTEPTRFADLTVGLTSGWWSFQDTDLRPDYALLGPDAWRALLEREGFKEPEAIAGAADAPIVARHQALLLARAPAETAERQRSGAWLILADSGGVGDRVAAALRRRGEHCVVARRGRACAMEPSGDWTLRAENPEDFEKLLRDGAPQWSGAVALWALDAPSADDLDSDNLSETERMVCGGALHLAQALARLDGKKPPRLWLATRRAQALASDPAAAVAVAQAPLWGLGKVVALEHPELHCTLVDLDGAEAAENVDRLVEDLLEPALENEIVYRADARYVSRLEACEPTAAHPLALRSDGTYLITGGFGGLGLLVARLLAQRGAGCIALMGRKGATAAQAEALQAVEEAGARVLAFQGDVCDRARLGAILSEIRESGMPLRGVIHAAGVLDDGVVLRQEWRRFAGVMAPKVRGAWLLHEMTLRAELDFFVLFSSGAATLGSAGQGNHAAANAFLDALAHHRRRCGLPALSINWGAWAEIGSVAEYGVGERIAAQGMGTLTPSQGLAAFERLVASDRTQVGVFAFEWERFFASHGDQRLPAFYAEQLRHARRDHAARTERPAPTLREANLRERLSRTAAGRQRRMLLDFLRERSRAVLGLDASRPIDPGQPLSELGLDSLMAVELRNTVSSAVERDLPATLLFDYPTLGELTGFLAGSVLAIAPEAMEAPQSNPPGEQAPADLDSLSEEELAQLLMRRLNGIDKDDTI